MLRNSSFKILFLFAVLLVDVSPASAARNFNVKNNSQSFIFVLGTSGNVGISSVNPGQLMDVQGTVRTMGFTMSGQTPIGGYVLTASDSAGDATWTSSGSVSNWIAAGNNIYNINTGNVGIDTTNGSNVGIGSLTPGQKLDVQGTVRALYFIGNGSLLTNISAGGWTQAGNNIYNTNPGNVGINTTNGFNVGIGTSFPQGGLVVMNGNLGVGTWAPTQKLAVAGGAILGNQNGTAADTVLIGDPPLGGYPGIWLGANAAAPAYSNYSFLSDGSGGNLFNAASGQLTRFRINNAATLTAGGNGVRIFGADTGNPADAPLYDFQVQTATSNFVINSSADVGVGTTTPQSALVVTNGNVGIGTWTAAGGNLIVNGGGNVGIGSIWPGQKLDVQGTVRTAFLAMSGQTPVSGYVLTASDSAGDATWTSAGGISGWTVSGSDVYETLGGNVGIGTWKPRGALDVEGTLSVATFGGNIGIGTWIAPVPLYVVSTGSDVAYFKNTSVSGDTDIGFSDNTGAAKLWVGYGNPSASAPYTNRDFLELDNADFGIWQNNGAAVDLYMTNGGNVGLGTDMNGASGKLIVINGNVGIGSLTPGQALDVRGTVRTTGFTMSGQTPISGYVLTASDSAGDTTWTSGGAVSGWTESGNDVYETLGGNVGIGTTKITTAALTVMNGNVGIGTWKPSDSLDVFNGNIGIGTGFSLVGIGTTPANSTILTLRNDASSIYLGWEAGASTVALGAASNAAVGTQALFNNSSGNGNNSAMGYFALFSDTTGYNNSGMGFAALDKTTTGSLNSAMGFDALFNNITGQYNVALGNNAGYPLGANGTQAGSDNVWLGANSGPAGTSDVNNSVGIGSYAVAGASNVMVLGGLGVNALNVGIGTDMNGASGRFIVLNGNVGIGSLAPGQTLDVQGTIRDTDQIVNGNVGIGTSIVNGTGVAALSVMNGNVGIGTWVPGSALQVIGNVGIGTATVPAYNLDLVNGTSRSRPVRRISTITETVTSTVTINSNITDVEEVSGFNNAAGITLTFANPNPSNPNDEDLLEVRVKDGGTAITIAWGANFASTTTTLPLTTIASTWLRILFEYNSATALWECVAST